MNFEENILESHEFSFQSAYSVSVALVIVLNPLPQPSPVFSSTTYFQSNRPNMSAPSPGGTFLQTFTDVFKVHACKYYFFSHPPPRFLFYNSGFYFAITEAVRISTVRAFILQTAEAQL